MKRLLAFFSLLFSPLLSLADPSSFSNVDAVANHTDLSVNYLSQLFGTVGNVLQGSSGQMLGHVLYKFNEGVVVLAGLWLGYSVFVMVIRASSEGSFLGQNKNVHLLFLRIALGFGLLIPNPTTGYNLLQDGVMKITVAGVGLADQTWDYALKYLDDGGAVWHQPSKGGTYGGVKITDEYVNSMLGKDVVDKGLLSHIFADEVCMISSTENSTGSDDSDNTTSGIGVSSNPKTRYDVIDDSANHRYVFPGNGGDNAPSNVSCGTVSYNIMNSCNSPDSDQCDVAKNAVYQAINVTKPAAKKFYCSINSSASVCSGIYTDNVDKDNEQDFVSALVGFANSIYPNMQSGRVDHRGFIKTAKAQGWLTAGRYYWDLAQTSWSAEQHGKLVNYVPSTMPASASGQIEQDYKSALNAAPTYKNGAVKLLVNLQSGSQAGGAGAGADLSGIGSGAYVSGAAAASTGAIAAGASAPIAAEGVGAGLGGITFIAAMTPVMIDMTHLIHTFSTGTSGGMSSDPIVFLHNIGMACFNISGDIWFLTGMILSLAFLGTGVCNATYNATPAVKGLVSWLKGFLYALAIALFLVGAILGFYLPLYPYMIFTFGVLGWMISVIEAMVAAPLVCFGLTHPEGHDFLGPVQQSVMLFLSVFLRPVLLLIGLIAGMILSYVSLRMVIYTFTGITTDLFSSHAGSAGGAGNNILAGAGHLISHSALQAIHSGSLGGAVLLSIVSFPIILAIFTIIVFTVTTTCYQLPNQFVNYIMTWIGGPQISNIASQAVQQVQSAFTGVPGKMPEMARSASQAFDQTMRDETMKKQAQEADGTARLNPQSSSSNSGSSSSGGSGGSGSSGG